MSLSLLVSAPAAPVAVLTVDELQMPIGPAAASAERVLARMGFEARRPRAAEAIDVEGAAADQARAEELYVEGDLAGASEKLTAAILALGGGARLDASVVARVQDLRLQLAKWIFTSDEANARELLADVVVADPGRSLEADRFAPKLRTLFNEVRSEVMGRPTGSLAVRSIPSGAAVVVDGRPLGTTPVTLSQLPAGEHAVWLEREGLRTVAHRVRTKGEVSLSLDLTYEWAKLGESGPPPAPLDEESLRRVAKALDSEAVLVLSYQRALGGGLWLVGAYVDATSARSGAVEVIGGAEDGDTLVERLVRGGDLEPGPKPAWLLPARPERETAAEADGGWLWMGVAIGAGVVVAAAGTGLGLLLIPPSEGRFNVGLTP